MASNGFPSGDFFITNVRSGLVITAVPGGVKTLGSANNRGGDEITYTRTAHPQPLLTTPLPSGKNGLQGWYYDTSDSRNLLVCRTKFDVRGRFVLQAQENDWPTMKGAGANGLSAWKMEDGLISSDTDEPYFLVARSDEEDGTYTLDCVQKSRLFWPQFHENTKWEVTPFS
ncbi:MULTISPECIES: hypothetical protein [Streptomyces]|uniref:Uncharacterized protein n=1 Tax=Streptomyces lasalocidi TaxID=324833 RepID=A0A4U5WN50_STRLS|nr:hypothetical protein [Streptomyces lasalocidi]TKT03644.1 hypothetical protein E4U91_28635 [Streptomyces lasalocidi]